MNVTPDMFGFDCLDAYLARRLTPEQLRALSADEKAERRRAQHRTFRARRREEALVALPAAPLPTRSPTRDHLALLDPRRDWIDVRTPGWAA